MAELFKLDKADHDTLAQINILLHQLTSRAKDCSPELLRSIVESQSVELWLAREGLKIVGMAELAIVLKPEGIIAQVEDVVVDEGQRGKGVGKMLTEKLIERARAQGASTITLSSRSDRTAANALYKKVGFELWQTNLYRLKL